ncbi:alpha/beta fold hydrolase [Christiangramia forsetii]|uniref:Alpha/beta fold hydrolase n=2 Tax=Christiangramia forsetii TaxID=411153 RepID=A0M641_CHRFK|nr:alpha/beta hydrolase [Christiangramia forsetii]GGG31460.1 alpha/beta hydrolase [Christiangramia forsetii]CAL68086.1 alpha/beta fold hydrolase [Christiangramia forsetii KT0803]
MSEINHKNGKIYYKIQGAGNKVPLVLLHGFLEDSEIWNPMVKDLQKERQIICIDLPGHGNSEGIAEVHSMRLMADVVREVLKTLGIEEVSIAGHSMGGYVSLEFLKNFPMMIKNLMLINSTPVEDTVEKQKIRERSVKLVGKNKEAFVSMAISNLYSEKSKIEFASEIEFLKSRAFKMKAENIQAALNGMKNRMNYLEELRRFSGQKIIVAGKQDPILEINEISRLSDDCDCEFHEMENGHNSYMEDMNNLRTIMHFID